MLFMHCSSSLMHFYESGIVDKLQIVTEESSIIQPEVTELFQPVDFDQMIQVFGIVVIGVCLATSLLIFEFFAIKMRPKKKKLRLNKRSDRFLVRLAAR